MTVFCCFSRIPYQIFLNYSIQYPQIQNIFSSQTKFNINLMITFDEFDPCNEIWRPLVVVLAVVLPQIFISEFNIHCLFWCMISVMGKSWIPTREHMPHSVVNYLSTRASIVDHELSVWKRGLTWSETLRDFAEIQGWYNNGNLVPFRTVKRCIRESICT